MMRRINLWAYLFDGLRQHRLNQVISAIPSLRHLSLLLFGVGLITCFFSLDDVVAYTALVVYSIVGTVYILLTIAPLIDLTLPFKTSISNSLWCTLQLIQLSVLYATRSLTSCISPDSIFLSFHLLECSANEGVRSSPKGGVGCILVIEFLLILHIAGWANTRRKRYHSGIVQAIEQDLESTHSNSDVSALHWAISSVQTDDELKSFIGSKTCCCEVMDRGEEANGVQFWLVLSAPPSSSLIDYDTIDGPFEAICTAELAVADKPHTINKQEEGSKAAAVDAWAERWHQSHIPSIPNCGSGCQSSHNHHTPHTL
jgi:hypothetical protein